MPFLIEVPSAGTPSLSFPSQKSYPSFRLILGTTSRKPSLRRALSRLIFLFSKTPCHIASTSVLPFRMVHPNNKSYLC